MKEMTDITLILDDSQSMMKIAIATREGINAFLAEQRANPLPAFFSLVKFHEQGYQHWQYKQVPMGQVTSMLPEAYIPTGGSTALYDTASNVIDATGQRLAAMLADQRPNKVLVAIMTDGQNNVFSGKTERDLRARIKHQREVYGWQFIYLGANQNAELEAEKICIPAMNAMTYSHDYKGASQALQNFAHSTSNYRGGGSSQLNK